MTILKEFSALNTVDSISQITVMNEASISTQITCSSSISTQNQETLPVETKQVQSIISETNNNQKEGKVVNLSDIWAKALHFPPNKL